MKPRDIEFDSPFTFIGGVAVRAPDIYSDGYEVTHDDECDVTINGMPWFDDGQDVQIMRGYSGQDRYYGAVMHPSEYVTEDNTMWTDLMEINPVWAAFTTVYAYDEYDDDEPLEAVGWCIIYKPHSR